MLNDKREVVIANETVVLDTSKLHFSESTLSEYLETEGGWIDYFGAKLADAEREYMTVELEVEKQEDDYERLFSRVFTLLKDTRGGSDKFVEGLTMVEPEVAEAKKALLESKTKLINLKHSVKLIHQHLRAWDKNHENAQNRGNTLRKEMERLHKDVVLEDEIHRLVKEVG